MISNITVGDLSKINGTIIDIRSKEKYNDNHIPKAKNISKTELVANPSKYLSKKEVYYIYCQYGKNSVTLCQYLSRLGYKTVNIIGGYESWILEK